MAVRFDAATDRVSYLGATDVPATYTATMWVYLSVDQNTFSTFFRIWTTAIATVVTVATDADGTSGPSYFTGSGSISNTTNFVVGEWRKVAITRTGSTGQIMVNTVGGTTEVDSGSVSTNVPDGLTIGSRAENDGNEWWNGRVAQVRLWDTVLTQGQIETEWASTAPVVTSGLWADWPLAVHTDLNDASGNGRHLTAGSTATTTEADPPNTVAATSLLIPRRPARGLILR